MRIRLFRGAKLATVAHELTHGPTVTQSRLTLMLNAPIPAMLFRLALPNVAATIIATATTFVDVWYVSQLGTEALASLALVFPFQTLMLMMAGGAIGGGVSSALSRALGAGEVGRAQSIAWHGALISIAMSLLYMLLLGLYARPIFAMMGGVGPSLDGAVLYARIAFGGAIGLWLFWVLSAVIRGTGDTDTPARAMLISGIAQIALSGALTLGWGPFPALGIAGPAAAFVICQSLGALYLLWCLIGGIGGITLRPHALTSESLKDIMRVGGLGLINSTTIAASVIVVTGFVGTYGTEALAGYGLGSRLELMLVPLTFGVGGAMTVAVGANFGAGQFARARRIAWVGAASVAALVGVIGFGVALAPSLWLDLFTADPVAYRFGETYLLIVGPAYVLFGFGQALYFASQGTGSLLLPVLVGLLRFALAASVGALAVGLGWPLEAVFLGVAAGMAVIGVGLTLCMWSRGWRPDRT